MCSICFARTTSASDGSAWLEEPEEHAQGYENTWGAFDENGKLLSGLLVSPAEIMINGKPVKAGLIGAVATLPEFRNARCVRKIFDKIMPYMKDKGMVYSLLYPFSFQFYRKFGYEHAYVRNRATFPISELSHYQYPDNVMACDGAHMWTDFSKVYDVFSNV